MCPTPSLWAHHGVLQQWLSAGLLGFLMAWIAKHTYRLVASSPVRNVRSALRLAVIAGLILCIFSMFESLQPSHRRRQDLGLCTPARGIVVAAWQMPASFSVNITCNLGAKIAVQ